MKKQRLAANKDYGNLSNKDYNPSELDLTTKVLGTFIIVSMIILIIRNIFPHQFGY